MIGNLWAWKMQDFRLWPDGSSHRPVCMLCKLALPLLRWDGNWRSDVQCHIQKQIKMQKEGDRQTLLTSWYILALPPAAQSKSSYLKTEKSALKLRLRLFSWFDLENLRLAHAYKILKITNVSEELTASCLGLRDTVVFWVEYTIKMASISDVNVPKLLIY
jgi:hypothetical protein